LGIGYWCSWEPRGVTSATLERRIDASKTLLFTIDEHTGCSFGQYDAGDVASWRNGTARAERTIPGPGPLMALVPRGDKWLACRIESWRERAERLDAELTATFAADTPWPLPEVLAKLAHAADTLFETYNYDGHGYEEIVSARDAARAFLTSFREMAQR
jgi:hypothetical protein